MITPRQWIDFHLLGRHRLEHVKKLPLGSTLTAAITLYGEPVASEPAEESSEITDHTFQAGLYHQVSASEWKGRLQSVVYWSDRSDPARDLRCMLESYEEGNSWTVMEAGYWYRRDDGTVKLWCSAMPAIGVAYEDFLSAKAELAVSSSLEKLDAMDDPSWAPNEVIHELQRKFALQGDTRLLDVARRSPRIAVSPDGRDVLVQRNHHTYAVGNGFKELNRPPDSATGGTTEVLNFFRWDETSATWGKIPLPRDAKVACMRFEGERCHLEIRSTTTGRILTLICSAAKLRMGRIEVSTEPLTDEMLWAAWEQKARD